MSAEGVSRGKFLRLTGGSLLYLTLQTFMARVPGREILDRPLTGGGLIDLLWSKDFFDMRDYVYPSAIFLDDAINKKTLVRDNGMFGFRMISGKFLFVSFDSERARALYGERTSDPHRAIGRMLSDINEANDIAVTVSYSFGEKKGGEILHDYFKSQAEKRFRVFRVDEISIDYDSNQKIVKSLNDTIFFTEDGVGFSNIIVHKNITRRLISAGVYEVASGLTYLEILDPKTGDEMKTADLSLDEFDKILMGLGGKQ